LGLALTMLRGTWKEQLSMWVIAKVQESAPSHRGSSTLSLKSHKVIGYLERCICQHLPVPDLGGGTSGDSCPSCCLIWTQIWEESCWRRKLDSAEGVFMTCRYLEVTTEIIWGPSPASLPGCPQRCSLGL
jgi:hypothetical protein